MATLYLDRRELMLKREGQAIALYRSGQRHGTVPMHLLERVVIRGKVELDTGLLGEMGDNGIAVMLQSERQGRKLAILLGRPHADARRRVAQCGKYQDPVWRAQWSKGLIVHKLQNQARVLRHALTSRPDQRKALSDAIASVEKILARLTQENSSLDRIRGFEGAGAAAYFSAYTRLFAPTANFTGRNRRPPRDPVNACLSLAYTLLHFDAVRASHAAGLDPNVGFFHELAHARESLAADLIEPLRAKADQWVWELFNTRKLRLEQFRQDGEACLMGKSARPVFYSEYEQFAAPLRRMLRRYTVHIARQWADEAAFNTADKQPQ
jgi:CRISPR-associated protein Cas1